MKAFVAALASGAGPFGAALRLGAVLIFAGGCALSADDAGDETTGEEVAEASAEIVCDAPPEVPPPSIGSLKSVPVPEPSNLYDFVSDKKAAIALGKAFFWDMQAGSDGLVACASCHFSAGADARKKNQMNPGRPSVAGAKTFEATASGGTGGPNYTLVKADFPFHRLADPNDRNSAVLFDSDDVVASQGVVKSTFAGVSAGDAEEDCAVAPDAVFHVGAANVRQVEPRNTPTVINAVFNVVNFWDGGANSHFNGVDVAGPRNPVATISVVKNGAVQAVKVAIDNGSLASQAVTPTNSPVEMACAGRTMRHLGRKMLGLTPLALQKVHHMDSVLAPLRAPGGTGLVGTYAGMIQAAFLPAYWDSTQTVQGFSVMEANFALFWGLAIQLYEATLVSDDSRFDRYMDGNTAALSPVEIDGMAIFTGKGRCVNCHNGPEFTAAGTALRQALAAGRAADRMVVGDCAPALYDIGFYNIGVRPTLEDIGRGATFGPFSRPISYARQAKGGQLLDVFTVNANNLSISPGTAPSAGERDAVDGAFKVPTLRNVQLTGPFFHNGGYGSLAQVIEFYNRGGDRRGPDGADTTGFGANGSNVDRDIVPLGLTAYEKSALLNFLASLTDDRVWWEKAPFDHPQLFVVNGHPSAGGVVPTDAEGRPDDTLLEVPAIGALGRGAEYLPALKGMF